MPQRCSHFFWGRKMEKRDLPQAGEVGRHFKGNDYKILAIATHTETQERLVVYEALYGTYGVYVRPLEMFMSPVDRKKYPEAEQEWRFERKDLNN